MTKKYDDIIDLPHHVSAARRHMSMLERAAQFQPFRALTGYGDAVREAARLTDERAELTEDEKVLLDRKLQELAAQIASQPQVSVTYFRPDRRKAGGAYVTVTGRLERIDAFEGALVLLGGERILIEDLLDIQ